MTDAEKERRRQAEKLALLAGGAEEAKESQ